MYVYIITSMTAVDAVVRAREGTVDGHNGPERGLLAPLALLLLYRMIRTEGPEALVVMG